MTDDKLPIVFKPTAGSKLAMFLIPGLLAAAAVWKALDDRFSTVRIALFGEVDAHVVAWLVAAILGAVSLFGLAMLVLRCPSLTLGENGIVIARCFRAPVTIPWSALDDIRVRSAVVGRRARRVDVVYLVTRDGEQVSPGPLGKEWEIASIIRRVATRMTTGSPEA